MEIKFLSSFFLFYSISSLCRSSNIGMNIFQMFTTTLETKTCFRIVFVKASTRRLRSSPPSPHGQAYSVSLFTLEPDRRVAPVTDHLRNREGFSRQILEDRGRRGRGLRGIVVKYHPYRSTTGPLRRQPNSR